MKRFFIFLLSVFLFLFVFIIQSCKHEPDNGCYIQRSYQNDIRPVVLAHCATYGCHVPGFVSGDFTLYQPLKNKADSGTLKLLVIDLKLMPPDSSISDKQRETIGCWILQGALDN